MFPCLQAHTAKSSPTYDLANFMFILIDFRLWWKIHFFFAQREELDIQLANHRFAFIRANDIYNFFAEQVYLANNLEDVNKIVDSIGYKDFLMQEYISSSKGKDLRINVVNKIAVVSMLRENKNDFRSNISNGGTGYKFEPKQEYLDLAIKASKALGLDFAGVDVMFGPNDEPFICELNSNPQFASTLQYTGVNLAEVIADYILNNL